MTVAPQLPRGYLPSLLRPIIACRDRRASCTAVTRGKRSCSYFYRAAKAAISQAACQSRRSPWLSSAVIKRRLRIAGDPTGLRRETRSGRHDTIGKPALQDVQQIGDGSDGGPSR